MKFRQAGLSLFGVGMVNRWSMNLHKDHGKLDAFKDEAHNQDLKEQKKDALKIPKHPLSNYRSKLNPGTFLASISRIIPRILLAWAQTVCWSREAAHPPPQRVLKDLRLGARWIVPFLSAQVPSVV